MRAVIGTVISSEPVSLRGAAAILSNFASAATGSRPELAVFSARASRAFTELLAFHRDLRSPQPAAAGDLHITKNRADPAQIGAGIRVGDESPSLGWNRAAGLENGAGSRVEREIDVKRKKMREMSQAAVENLVSDERDGKMKRKKERVEMVEGNRSREVELAVRREELEEMNAGVDGNAAPGIDNARDEKRKKRKERSRDAELAMNATNRPEGGAVHEKRYEGVIDNGALPRIVNAAVDNGVVPGIDNERGGKKKRKNRSRDAELAVGREDPGMNAVSRLEAVYDERDEKSKTLKERAVPDMGVVQPEVKVEKEEFGEERSEERKKKKKREKNKNREDDLKVSDSVDKNREDDLKVSDSVVKVEVKLEKEEFGEDGRYGERRNREGEVNVAGGGKKRRHLDDIKEEGGLEGRREPHNNSAELGDQSEQHHKKKRRKRE